MKSDKVVSCIFIPIALLIVIISIVTLSYSPKVWYDEIFFSSMTHSLLEGRGLALELDSGEPFYIYGPVYFGLTWLTTKLFGFTIFSFRAVNLFFSFGCLIILNGILRQQKISTNIRICNILLVLSDVLFTSNGHSGRMEFVALFFLLCSYLFAYSKYKYKSIFVSISLTILALTTPRAIVVAIPIAIYISIKLIKAGHWRQLVLYVFIPLITYLVWIFFSYGSISDFIQFFTQKNEVSQDASLSSRFFGGNFYVPKWNYPLIMLLVLILIHSIKYKYINKLFIYLAPIILFYFLIYDTGMYSVYILPFYSIILAIGLSNIRLSDRRIFHTLANVLLLIILLVNIGIFAYKTSSVFYSMESRNPYMLSEWFADNVPENSRIIGSCEYYYAAIDNKCTFKKMFRDYVSSDVVFADLQNNFKPQYLFVSDSESKQEALDIASRFNKQKIGHYSTDSSAHKKNRLFDVLFGRMVQTYEGDLYQIIY